MTVEKRRKKKILVILAIVLVCCLAIIGTLAWLRWRTPEVENTFTLGNGVKVELEEKKYWEEKNQERVKNFTPGMLLDKDPTVCIPEEVKVDEYIAATVRYYIEEVDYTKNTIQLKEVSYNDFEKYAEIYSFAEAKGRSGESVSGSSEISTKDESKYDLKKGIRNGWVHDENYRIFYYGVVSNSAIKTKSEVSTTVSTTGYNDDIEFTSVTSGAAITLFDKVKIAKAYDRYGQGFEFDKYRYKAGEYTYIDIDGKESAGVLKTEGELRGFKIVITAYAVQGNINHIEEDKTSHMIGKETINGLIDDYIGISLP